MVDPQRLAAMLGQMGSPQTAVPQAGAAIPQPAQGLPPGMPQQPPMPMQAQAYAPGQGQDWGQGAMGGPPMGGAYGRPRMFGS